MKRKRIVPLLVAPDIEKRSGVLFDRKGHAIQPSAGLTTGHIRQFMAASDALIARTGIESEAS
ncbi:hypothetical protein [Burkholderia sp. BCC1977]|uniref:hypothetical protein n=1 Tax=Burkholderia sp. BCC1977 TaxID=2817440 RepID=UPI002ABE9B22|nr:hypothetical protein [Burkholderia sp. BCC1977]